MTNRILNNDSAEEAATRLGIPVDEYREQVRLADEIADEIIKQEQAIMNYHPLSNDYCGDHPPLSDDPGGRWLCTCGDDREVHIDVLEAHRCTGNPKKMTFRVSTFDRGKIRLGPCAILNVDQLRQLRDCIDAILGSE